LPLRRPVDTLNGAFFSSFFALSLLVFFAIFVSSDFCLAACSSFKKAATRRPSCPAFDLEIQLAGLAAPGFSSAVWLASPNYRECGLLNGAFFSSFFPASFFAIFDSSDFLSC
jgi:hypothetical protein